MRRTRNAKIVATLGPASSGKDMIRRLFLAGVDVFRLNFSHGSADDHRARFAVLRELEQETGRPIGILADLQGPKLRVGSFVGAARERPESPVLSLTPRIATARRLALVWGVHSVHTADVADVDQMTARACEVARREGFAEAGQTIVAIAGMPFGTPGTTNLMRIAMV